jgi:hypothetical protein
MLACVFMSMWTRHFGIRWEQSVLKVTWPDDSLSNLDVDPVPGCLFDNLAPQQMVGVRV